MNKTKFKYKRKHKINMDNKLTNIYSNKTKN